MSDTQSSRIPSPPDPHRRQEPLPWQRPKPPEEDPEALRRRYIRFVKGSSSTFFRLVDMYYDHSFRELFLNGTGPLQVHRAAMAILSGWVFPRPPFALRWRFALLDLFTRINRFVPLVPRRERFSLLSE